MAAQPRPVTRGFQAPPEVTGYFDGKGDKPSFSWQDVYAEEHAYAFTAAKAVDVELRTALRDAISKGIREGRTFDNFVADLQPELQRLGWWGPRLVTDPSGMDPDKLVDFSSRRRLETMFWANMRSARAAGQWQRIQRAKRGLPYLLYVRSAAAEPRAEHLGWVGIILPVDHEWWQTHFPPNGWGCKCSVRQISKREADLLLTAERKEDGIWYVSEPPEDGPPREFRNRRSGEISMVPAGIDPGWQTNPGLSRARTMIDNLSNKLETAAPEDAAGIVEELWADPIVPIMPNLPEKTWMPAGVAPALQEELNAKSPIVSIASDAVGDRMVRHRMTVKDFAALPALLGSPSVLPSFQGKATQPEENARTVIGRMGKTWWRVIVTRSVNGLMRVRSIHQRNGREIARQILDGGFGHAGLVKAGFSEEEIEAILKREQRRGEGNNPIG